MTRRGLVTGVGAAGMLGLAGCSTSGPRGQPSAHAAEAMASARVIWAVTGADGLTAIEIDHQADSPVNTASVTTNGRLRFTSDRTGSDGNHRQVWLIPGTDDFTDGEVRTTFWPPSVIDVDISLPQMGLATRLTDDGALIVDQNITMGTYGYLFLAPWAWPKGHGPSRRGASQTDLRTTTARAPLVNAVLRTSGTMRTNVYLVDRTYEFEEGDPVEVAGCVDESFNGSFTVTEVVPAANQTVQRPAIICEDRSDGVPVDLTMTVGRMTRPGSKDRIDPRSLYPFHVALRSVGARATAKRWRVGDVEPTWDDPTATVTIDTADDPLGPPDSGGVGLVTNHLRNGAWVEFGDVEVIRYR